MAGGEVTAAAGGVAMAAAGAAIEPPSGGAGREWNAPRPALPEPGGPGERELVLRPAPAPHALPGLQSGRLLPRGHPSPVRGEAERGPSPEASHAYAGRVRGTGRGEAPIGLAS